MAGCKHRIVFPPPLPTPEPPPLAATPERGAEATVGGKYLTGDALKPRPEAEAAAPVGSLVHEVALHLVSEHLLELQALAAVTDSLTLRSEDWLVGRLAGRPV